MRRFACILLCLCLLCVPYVFAAESIQSGVHDETGVLTAEEKTALEAGLKDFAQRKKVNVFYVLVNQSYYEGEDFLPIVGLDEDDDVLLVCITQKNGIYYFDLYTFGAAENRITDGEVELILDAGMPIKSGELARGLSAMTLEMDTYYQSAGAYWGKCFLIAFCVSLAIGIGVYLWVFFAYRRKNRGVSYPLESYTNLELTMQDDRFMGTFVTKTRIPKPSSSGGGGGGRVGGGGGGHRGGR